MVKGTNRVKHATNVRKQHDVKSPPKYNKGIPILPGYHIEQCDGEPPKVEELWKFIPNKKNQGPYICRCKFHEDKNPNVLRNHSDEKTHKQTKDHLKYIEEKQRLCRERYAIQYKKEEKKKRMKELEESITIYDKRIQKIIARKLKDVREYEKLEMELRSIDMYKN
jgi:hypothetical protein